MAERQLNSISGRIIVNVHPTILLNFIVFLGDGKSTSLIPSPARIQGMRLALRHSTPM